MALTDENLIAPLDEARIVEIEIERETLQRVPKRISAVFS